MAWDYVITKESRGRERVGAMRLDQNKGDKLVMSRVRGAGRFLCTKRLEAKLKKKKKKKKMSKEKADIGHQSSWCSIHHGNKEEKRKKVEKKGQG